MKPKTALVTGSTSGIGLAISDALAREGYSVVLTGRRETVLADLVGTRKKEGLRVEGIPADLSLASEAARLFEESLARLGGRLDVLVNNAGAYAHLSVAEVDAERFDALMALNLRAPFLLSGKAFPVMKRQAGGTIVNISSVAGLEAWSGTSLYSATKFGLRALTQSLLAEGAPFGIKCGRDLPGLCPHSHGGIRFRRFPRDDTAQGCRSDRARPFVPVLPGRLERRRDIAARGGRLVHTDGIGIFPRRACSFPVLSVILFSWNCPSAIESLASGVFNTVT